MRNPLRKRSQGKTERGIALFMVMSAVALLSVLVAELTYSSQMNSRLAYNYADGLKAYYLAKAGYKLSLLRLKAYLQVKDFLNNPSNKMIKDTLDKSVVEKIWSMPFIFPLPIPKEASMGETDAIKEFLKESKLGGSFTASITGESSKLNLNNLLVKEAAPLPSASPGASPTPRPATTATTAQPTPSGSPSPVEFIKVLEPAITTLIETKKDQDRDFADTYRNVTGQDVIDAIRAYIFPDTPGSNLPGFKPIKPKQAPFYSLTELHFIPGIDDQLYNLLESALTVYSTPGINVNTFTKQMLISLIPELQTMEEAEEVLRKRDDPDVGQPWASEEDFWKAIEQSAAGRNLNEVKDRFQKANLRVITEEQSFKISILANVGQATRRLEAFVTIDPNAGNQAKNASSNPNNVINPLPGVNVAGQPPNTDPNQKVGASAKKPTGVNLIYWRMM
ncbi:MAG: type II secretion system protein GspK [Bdellovibrionota bacterium]